MKKLLIVLTLWLGLSVPALGAIEGTLIAGDRSNLDIYPQPNTELPPLGTAEVGEKVAVLERVFNNQQQAWDRIRLIESSNLEGWIPDSYVEKEQSAPYDASNYYQPNQF